MFQPPGRRMRWSSLLKDIKEKVGLSNNNQSSVSLYPVSVGETDRLQQNDGLAVQTSRQRHELELEFKRCWELFRSSGSEKEKEDALNVAVDVFCRLVKQQPSVQQLLNTLVEPHIFSFVIGRAFVADIQKLKKTSNSRSLHVASILSFFTKNGLNPGFNLLCAVQALVSGPIDKQPLLDSGILSCLVGILNILLNPVDEEDDQPKTLNTETTCIIDDEGASIDNNQLEVEGMIVHIMKALSSHPTSAQSLIEDDSLQIIFQMIANGSLTVFARFRMGLVPLHTLQLHRHAMQILGLLLVNDNGSTARYIQKHHLIKVLLMAVKDFNPETGDPAYTMGIVDLLLECVELSYRPDAGGVRLREDIHNAHGYQFLVQFALILSALEQNQLVQSTLPKQDSETTGALEGPSASYTSKDVNKVDSSSPSLSPSLSRLLDVLVNLAQVGPFEPIIGTGGKVSRSTNKASGHHSRPSSTERIEYTRAKDTTKVKDLEAVQVLQDILLKANNVDLQAEILNRMLKIFSSDIENYKLCQQLRTVPLFILNMAGFPGLLREKILKILEYAVTVVNCIPEQELLSLCCLLQQPIETDLKYTILSFFVKLLSFDQQYKKVLREVGVLEVLLDDIKQNKYASAIDQLYKDDSLTQELSNSNSFNKHMEEKDAIITSPKMLESRSTRISLFEDEVTISVAWDCLISLLKKAEANQSYFRASNGFALVLPFLAADSHRTGVLRLLSFLIIEDTKQVHHEELGALIEILKSGIVSSISGSQCKLHNDAKCDILGALWRIFGLNFSAQKVFGEATGFSLLLTVLHSFHSDGDPTEPQLMDQMNVFCFLLRVMTAGVCSNALNRISLHSIISSQTFYDLLCESNLLSVDHEKDVIQLLLELSLEVVLPPSANAIQGEGILSSDATESGLSGYLLSPSSSTKANKQRVYNAGGIVVLIRSLLFFTPKVQLDLLNFIEKIARSGPFNQENLTSVGCVGLLLETIHPFLLGSSPLMLHALRVVEALASYRLSSSELRVLVRLILQVKLINSSRSLVKTMERLVNMEEMYSESVSLAPFIEMDMSKLGHSSVQASLGERTWPPAAGYSFACWFYFSNFLTNQVHENEQQSKTVGSKRVARHYSHKHALRIFSVGTAGEISNVYAELLLDDTGVFTLSTSNSSSISFPSIELEEGRWHHLAVIHNKPNALAGLFQASVAYLYLNGRLRHTGKLGYSPSPAGKALQVIIGTPPFHAKVSELSWRLRSCYLYEEVLTSSCIYFMYILGRGYRGLFQDTHLLQFVPDEACGGDSMAILDSLDPELIGTPGSQKFDSTIKQGSLKSDGSGLVWDLEQLNNLSLLLPGKKLIFAFDGTSDTLRVSGVLSMLNLVDPLSAAASPIGGIPRFGRLHGDIYICSPCVIGDTIRTIGGMTIVLAFVEAAETTDMLHMALSLLGSALHRNPQNVQDMQAYRGYHLLALFLHRRMALFDMHSLDIFFQIAACEASFPGSQKLHQKQNVQSAGDTASELTFDDSSFPKLPDEFSSLGSNDDIGDFVDSKDLFANLPELENSELHPETTNCIVLSNADMVEHVLLDWTLWVAAPVSIQIALLGFLERLVSMHWYRNHNLTVLRQINLVQHLLVTLQRGDVEVSVLEKLVVLLGVILEDGFLVSELELVVRFVIMTFDPPEITQRNLVARESMGKHVIVRNMLLEMLIDLQVTIKSEELLEQWHKIVSSKLITYFLDEAVHPTSMRWIMTLLGVCLASSPTFVLKFRNSGGFLGLTRVLPSFYDSPEVYYILFCLVFGKPVYPRLPEVRILDFHALIPTDSSHAELKFVDLIDSIISMAKATFDRLSLRSMLACQSGPNSQANLALAADLVEVTKDVNGDFQGEALMHKTYAARLMSGEPAAPSVATAILRFIVDVTKMCQPFSAACRRVEFLESCVDLYFSCVRAASAVKMLNSISVSTSEDKNLNDLDDARSSQHEQEESAKTSMSVGSFPKAQVSTSSEDSTGEQNVISNDNGDKDSSQDHLSSSQPFEGNHQTRSSNNLGETPSLNVPESGSFLSGGLHSPNFGDSMSSNSLNIPESPAISEQTNSRMSLTPTSSPILALTSWLSGSSTADMKTNLASPSLSSSLSPSDMDPSQDPKSGFRGSLFSNLLFPTNAQLLLEMDDAGYGGGPCSASASAVLDFISEVFADIMTEQIKATLTIDGILEAVPLYIDSESTLVFQGLCLGRLTNFLERRLLRDEEESDKKLDKSRWSVNLETFCWMIVDRIYMGAFPLPTGVLRILEFLLSMLQLANKDGRVEEASPTGKGLLSIGRGSRQLEAYVLALLKNTNRMIMYCFLPSFLGSIGEDNLLQRLGFQIEPRKSTGPADDVSLIDISTVLQLLIANQRLIICPNNRDTDVICCLCINLIYLLQDSRPSVQSMAMDIFKYLLLHRRAALEELLIAKQSHGQYLDVLHGGFDKLLSGSSSNFSEWLLKSEQIISKVLEQCAAIMWVQYISGSAKFPGVRIKGMEGRRKREMVKKSREISKMDMKHLEQIGERRYALELVRDAMATELRVLRQDKYGWVLHAESEWQSHLQQIIHERGIFPVPHSSFTEDPEWQLCPIEGPYRMRKKLERYKLTIHTIDDVLNKQQMNDENNERQNDVYGKHEVGSGSVFNLLSADGKEKDMSGKAYDESFSQEADYEDGDSTSACAEWDDGHASSANEPEPSLHSALEFGMKSSSFSLQFSESVNTRSDLGSPRQSSVRNDETRVADEKSDKDLNDNGEYLIRPYLEPMERIRFRYNCERVVGLDKHDGIFLIGEFCLYVIENFYIDDAGCICEKAGEDELSVIDQALGVAKDVTGSMDFQSKSPSSSWRITMKALVGGRAWAYSGGAWGKEKASNNGNLPHPWSMWKLDSVHEILKRDYQLRPVAIEIFSMDGNNDLLVFHKKEREEVFKYLVAMNLPRNSMLDSTISASKQDSNERSRIFKTMAKSFSKRWQAGEISNFQYLMHLNTLAGRGYNDLTQYPVFPWVIADYESETLDLSNPKTYRKLDKPMGCQTAEGEEEFRKRFESWDDPEVPKFHYGSHYSSAGIVLFYLLRLPPFSAENQKLQGGQFDHADRLFNSIRDTWLSASGKGNTSDVKELIPEFFYMPEFLENRFNLDFGEKQSGEKVGDVILPPWAKGSTKEFIRKHREALESDYVSENLHHWIDLIFGYKQRGKAAEEAINVFYHYTYEGSVDIDSVADPALKASILAQINHFGQTPKQLFLKTHVKRKSDWKLRVQTLQLSNHLVPQEVKKTASFISQIVVYNDKVLVAGRNNLLKPSIYSKYVSWGYPDRSLRFVSYDQDKLLTTHESLHGGNQIECAGFTHDGEILVTGGDDSVVSVWRVNDTGTRGQCRLQLKKSLCAHTAKITSLCVSQPYTLIVSGSDDRTVILWDLSSLVFVKQLPEFSASISAVYVNDLTGEIITAAGLVLAIWSINGECLAVVNTSQLPSDSIVSVTGTVFLDWFQTNWFATGHQSGAIKVWRMAHNTDEGSSHGEASGKIRTPRHSHHTLALNGHVPEYRLILHKILKGHKHPVTALHVPAEMKQLYSGDSDGHLFSWSLPDDSSIKGTSSLQRMTSSIGIS